MFSKKPILYLALFAGLCWMVFTSWYPNEESYTVEGKITALHGSVENSVIWYTQDEKNLSDFNKMNSLDVTNEGNFRAVINIESHGPVYFFAVKDRYTPIRITKNLEKIKGVNDLGTIQISSLYNELSVKQIQDKALHPKLPVYSDECLDSFDDEIRVDNIFYFSELKNLPACHESPEKALLTAKVNITGAKKDAEKRVYFELTKQEDGEATIDEQASNLSQLNISKFVKED